MKFLEVLLFVIYFSNGVFSTTDGSTYIAGVVEYHQPRLPIYDAVDVALEAYEHFMDEAKTKSVDILVFPEATINYHPDAAIQIPTVESKGNPCNNPKDFSKILKRLSCAAKKNNLYVVVNLAERAHFCDEVVSENCTSTEENDFLFNTNIVLDRQGTIISRYRKINLFIEPGFSPSLSRDVAVFETDFGLKFGHFICFDILFQQPAVQMVDKEKVRNILYPTMWFSQLPFYAATALQESWAYTHNVNLLVAGANNVKMGNTGTGIYSGKKGLQVGTMFGEEASEMFVLELPKYPDAETVPGAVSKIRRPDPNTMDSLHLFQENLIGYDTVDIQAVGSQYISVKHNNMHCDFNIKTKQVNQNQVSHAYTYRAIIFDGVKKLTEATTAGIANCGIIACLNSSLESCGLRFPKYSALKPSIEFVNIDLNATVLKPVIDETVNAMDGTYGPMTLDTSVMAIGVDEYEYTVTDDSTDSTKQVLKMSLIKPQMELLTFGIMGRVFKKDRTSPDIKTQAAGYPVSVAESYLFRTTI